MGAGYSKRSLVDKLGIKSGYRIAIINAPSYDSLLTPLPDGVIYADDTESGLDFIQMFSTSHLQLAQEFRTLAGRLKPNGMLWVSWPKGSSKVPTDLNENVIREIGLAGGMVDVKVIAVDQVWSGLKFVYRLKDRPSN